MWESASTYVLRTETKHEFALAIDLYVSVRFVIMAEEDVYRLMPDSVVLNHDCTTLSLQNTVSQFNLASMLEW